MQLAFTKHNSFLLTTDGRVFSWGKYVPALGRENKSKDAAGGGQNNDETATQVAASKHHGEADNNLEGNNLGEVMFTNSRGRAHIVQIATGSSHVLALDTAGNVYAWGSNNSGQLGLSEKDTSAKITGKTQKSNMSALNGGDEE